jgi:hypothetical protein
MDDDDDKYGNFIKDKIISNSDSRDILIEENKIKIRVEDEKESIEHKIGISVIQTKRRSTLLKRTASEPKLIENDIKSDENSKNNEKESAVGEIKGKIVSNSIIEINDSHMLKNKKLLGSIKFNTEEANSSFDEIFFYHFENLLVEYLDKKYYIK